MMPEPVKNFSTMDLAQARALVEHVENPQNPVGVGLLTWAQYYQAKIALLQSDLAAAEKMRYTHLAKHPRALNAVELEAYIVREAAYMQERLAYVASKLVQLWHTAGLTDRQAQMIREGLELSFTYRELTEMWERGS
jgi:hypothetical protein